MLLRAQRPTGRAFALYKGVGVLQSRNGYVGT